MAMLAEPRRKQKLSINPQGTAWSNDESKFGQKMLEKMGWSKGKGLGAKEDGRVDHVRINLKNDQKGVGCSKNYADNWIAHQDDFNSLLESLNQGHGEEGDNSAKPEKQVASLEKKSMTSRKRVHYGKFTRGKDLSSRSHHDLKCIFGQRGDKTASGENTPTVESAESSGSEDSKDPNVETSHGFTTIRSTSNLQEYFAKKMAAMKGGQQTAESKPEDQDVAEEDVEEEVEEKKSKKKKKKKKKKSKDLEVEESEIAPESIDNDISSSQERTSKKCKKSKKVLEEDSDNDKKDNEFDMKKQKKEKKSKKRKKNEENEADEEDKTVEVEETVEADEQPPKKKKKKKKNSETKSSEVVSLPVVVQKQTVLKEAIKSPQKNSGRTKNIRRKRSLEVSHVIQTVSKSFRGANVAQIAGYDKLSMNETEMLRRIEERQKVILDRKN